MMTAEQARVAGILAQVARQALQWLKDDQAATYPLPGEVSVVIRSRRVAKRALGPVRTEDGSLEIVPLGGDRVRFTAHRFGRAARLWNGPDVLSNRHLRRMLASLFHDLIWGHRKELAGVYGCTETEILRCGDDVLYLVWVWASKDSWWGRREAWLSFQACEFGAPRYHRWKEALGALLLASLLAAGCAGCYSLPDGEVESVEGAEIVEQVMRDWGDGLAPVAPEETEDGRKDKRNADH